MKGKAILVVAVCLAAVSPAAADYTSIVHNLIDGQGDTTFTAGDGKLVVAAGPGANAITLNDDPAVPAGTITDGQVYLETYLDSVSGTTGVFKSGTFSLTFKYDGLPYEISGTIRGMELDYNYQTSTFSTMDGEALWDAVVKNLPGSNVWPDMGGSSSMTTLTLNFGAGDPNFAWDMDVGGQLRSETQYTLWPDDRAVPEPAALILIGLGGLGFLRRRRA